MTKMFTSSSLVSSQYSQQADVFLGAASGGPPLSWLTTPRCTHSPRREPSSSSWRSTTTSTSMLHAIPRGGEQSHPDNDNDNNNNSKRKNKSKATKRSAPKKKESPRTKKEATSPLIQEILQESDLYKILGVPREELSNSNKEERMKVIQKAYRKRCLQTHPDKQQGDRRAFDKVRQAYDTLMEEPDRTSTSSTNFRNFMKEHFQQHVRRNRTVRYSLDVRLEDLYTGMTQDIRVQAPSSQPYGYYHQARSAPSSKTVQVHIPKGAHHGQRIVLSGEMDFETEQAPSDIVFVINERPHAVFTRKGYDLAMEVNISIQEAITGVVRRKIRHLDGRDVTLVSNKKSHSSRRVIHTGDVQVLKGHGMPKDSTSYGDLYVQYSVELPKVSDTRNLSDEETQKLCQLLNKLEGKASSGFEETDDDPSVRFLEEASVKDFGRNVPHHFEHEDNDDQWAGVGGFSPFGNGRFQFGSTSSNPFFGDTASFDDDPNVQCQQM